MPTEIHPDFRERRAALAAIGSTGLGDYAWRLALIQLALVAGIALMGAFGVPVPGGSTSPDGLAFVPDADQVLSMSALAERPRPPQGD